MNNKIRSECNAMFTSAIHRRQPKQLTIVNEISSEKRHPMFTSAIDDNLVIFDGLSLDVSAP